MDNINDKVIYGVLAVILLITSFTLILQMHDVFKANDILLYTPETAAVPVVTSEPEESPLLRNKNLSRPLSGVVVMLAEDGSYIRLSVINEGVLSIGVTEDTEITSSSTPITLEAIPPFSEVMLEVVPLEDSQMYDFLAISVDITSSPNLQLEGDLDQLGQVPEPLDN